MTKKKKQGSRPQPLVPPPQAQALRSRKRARRVTTLFHKYTQERDAAIDRAILAGCQKDDLMGLEGKASNLTPSQTNLLDNIRKIDAKISEIGGREEYQRASQLNTSIFSTSKWVLGILGKLGWLHGLPTKNHPQSHEKTDNKKRRCQWRDLRLLEVGAINTQLIDAAAKMRRCDNYNSHVNTEKKIDGDGKNDSRHDATEYVYRLDVQAIDIRPTDSRIQEMDFFDLHRRFEPSMYYDVIVNSMVVNCVTNPSERGKMLHLCYKYLRPGGICFLMLPKLCLIQSKFMSRSYFEEILIRGLGFEIMREFGKDSPKIAFFVLRRPEEENIDGNKQGTLRTLDEKFTQMKILHQGKQFRNTFAVTLNKEDL